MQNHVFSKPVLCQQSSLMLFFLFLSSLLLPVTKLRAQKQKKYNVLFIFVDDMNDRCELFGNKEIPTPNLSRLRKRGVNFKNAYCQFPLCNPSRTSLLSGLRPDETHVFGNAVSPASVIQPGTVYMPEYFKSFGYHTERYGKIMHDAYEDQVTWDYAQSHGSPSEKAALNLATTAKNQEALGAWWVTRRVEPDIDVNDFVERVDNRSQQSPFFYAVGLSTHRPFAPALKYWNKIGSSETLDSLPVGLKDLRPRIAGNNSNDIELPSTPPNDRSDVPRVAFPNQAVKEPYEWKEAIHAYDGEVAQMDAQLGLILDELDKKNLWHNTIVVFTSDHGQHLGEHEGLWFKNTLFKESLGVPFIICAPGKLRGDCDRLIELVDVYPTLADLCGLPIPSNLEGTSFAPLLGNLDLPWKQAAFSQVKRGKLMGRNVRTERYSYNTWGSHGEELYDYDTDPHEYTNLATDSSYSTVLKRMRRLLKRGWQNAVPASTNADLKSNLISLNNVEQSVLKAYPNPGYHIVTLSYQSNNEEKISIVITNASGQIVFSKKGEATKDLNTYQLNVANLAKGNYYISLKNNLNQSNTILLMLNN